MARQGNAPLIEIRLPPVVDEPARTRPKKKLTRRVGRDYSQSLRRAFQLVFLVWNAYLGGLFYLWVRAIERGESTPHVTRPPGVEGWLPIAGLMNLKYWLASGSVPRIHPAAMFLLITFLSVSFLFRKAFCSWLCPVGTLSEYLGRAGHKLVRRKLALPRWLDISLRGLKYLLLGFFVWVISSMSAEAIAGFMATPYGLIANVKMLDFFRHLGTTAALVLAGLALASLVIENFWCRYLCPYGALLGLVSMLSPTRLRRNAGACIDCGKCAAACPSSLPVDKRLSIQSAECTACLECVAACPARDALGAELAGLPGRAKPKFPAWVLAAGIALTFFAVTAGARFAGHWRTDIAAQVYSDLVPRAAQLTHPRP